MIKPRSAFVDADDIRLHYLEWDPQRLQSDDSSPVSELLKGPEKDNIPIVMLHGLGATAETWYLTAEHIYRDHLVIAFDIRGHGESDQPENGYDLVTVAEDVIQGMAALGLGQVALVGHGWGARVALVLTARHQALISHLILVDCPLVEPRHWPGMTRERFIREQGPREAYGSMKKYLYAMRQEMADFWSPQVEEIVKSYVQEMADGTVEDCLKPENQRKIREAVWEDRAVSYYGKLSCPVLLIPAASQPQPGEEPPERLEDAEDFSAAKGYMVLQVARAIPRCSLLWMADTAHDIQLHRPAVLAEAIKKFVKD